MSPREIIRRECERLGCYPEDVTGMSRCRWASEKRTEVARALRAAGLSYPKIGKALGARHHTTILHLLGGLSRRRKNDRRPAVVTRESIGASGVGL